MKRAADFGAQGGQFVALGFPCRRESSRTCRRAVPLRGPGRSEAPDPLVPLPSPRPTPNNLVRTRVLSPLPHP